jgi:hypothetical protein
MAMVAGVVRETLDSREVPVVYLGSTTDLMWRWRDISDEDGEKCGHSLRWYAQVVLWGGLRVTGEHCAEMEEHLIATFMKHLDL